MALQQSPKKGNPTADFIRHKEDLRQASEQASKLISTAATDASKVISEAAAVAVRLVSSKNADDHDLLIELKTGMGYVRGDIANLTTGVMDKIAKLELTKANKEDFDILVKEFHGANEERMRKLEIKTTTYSITLGLLITAIGILVSVMLLHIF